MIIIDREKIEKFIALSQMRQCDSVTAACNKLVRLYKPNHKMIKGKHVIEPSLMESSVEKVIEQINADPFA